ncbi:uncharacterized protein LOC111080138 [Drosophila obscura]|uniref:uncharacterized protein LOC111080138 n=1 Tax=Drosophila obscura TaxID=7282 RepID=UPI000BA0C197|nr:uncharacterized protein LOC111080138 [Drosophila obscura]
MLMDLASQMLKVMSTASRCFHRSAVVKKTSPLDHAIAIDCTSRTTRRQPVREPIFRTMYPPVRSYSRQHEYFMGQFRKMSDVQTKDTPPRSVPKCPTELMWKSQPKSCPKCDERFDVLLYRASDKFRPYQRTWWECCPRLVPKRVCRWSDAIPPQVKRHRNKETKGLSSIAMPCCRAPLVPPNCPSWKPCKKIKCPFPSFSECVRSDLVPERPSECRCLERPPICIASLYARKMGNIYPCRRS